MLNHQTLNALEIGPAGSSEKKILRISSSAVHQRNNNRYQKTSRPFCGCVIACNDRSLGSCAFEWTNLQRSQDRIPCRNFIAKDKTVQILRIKIPAQREATWLWTHTENIWRKVSACSLIVLHGTSDPVAKVENLYSTLNSTLERLMTSNWSRTFVNKNAPQKDSTVHFSVIWLCFQKIYLWITVGKQYRPV